MSDHNDNNNNEQPNINKPIVGIEDGKMESDVIPEDLNNEERKSLFSYYITNNSPKIWCPIDPSIITQKNINHRKKFKGCTFYRISGKGPDESLKEIYISVYENFVQLSKAEEKLPTVCLDVYFSTLKYSEVIDYNRNKNAPYYSVKIIKNDKFEEFVSKKKSDIDKLFRLLSRYCIQTSIQKDYTPMYGLGKGAFCKVFQAKKNDTGEEVAVKVYDTDNIYQAKQQEWVQNELKLQMMLNNDKNKHNQRIIGIYEGKRYIYVVNKLAKGGELLDYVVENLGRIEDIDSLRIVFSVCKSLEYQKKKQIIHRDIKPSNILRKKEDNVGDQILIDFGLSIQQQDLKNLEKNKLPFCVGTPGFIAPEMLDGKHFDTKSDIWSLGCLFYLLLTGYPLFSAKNTDEILLQNRKCAVDLEKDEMLDPEWYPPLVLELQKGMLKKNPDERYSVEQILNHEIMVYAREDWEEREKEELAKESKERIENGAITDSNNNFDSMTTITANNTNQTSNDKTAGSNKHIMIDPNAGAELVVKRFTPADIQQDKFNDDNISVVTKNIKNNEMISDNVTINDNQSEILGKSPSIGSQFRSVKRLFNTSSNRTPNSNFDIKPMKIPLEDVNFQTSMDNGNMSPFQTPKQVQIKYAQTPKVSSSNYQNSEPNIMRRSPDISSMK